MDKKRIMRLRTDAQKMKPSVHVGKDGFDSMVVNEIDRQLEKNNIVKVRVLGAFEGDRQDIATAIAERTCSILVDVRGSTIVLARDKFGQI